MGSTFCKHSLNCCADSESESLNKRRRKIGLKLSVIVDRKTFFMSFS